MSWNKQNTIEVITSLIVIKIILVFDSTLVGRTESAAKMFNHVY